jgi:hypothetical protein
MYDTSREIREMLAADEDQEKDEKLIHTKFGWPNEISTIEVVSSLDGTKQPSLWYSPPSNSKKRPLLIALHTWSCDYRQSGGQVVFAKWCIEHQWHFLHPNFRGPNGTPETCGSELALQDILDAIQHVKEVDEDRIYVVGVSGGAHMALLLAALYPKLWAGVSAWSGISDLQAWWKERSAPTSECQNHGGFQKYAQNIESVLGGVPNGGQQEDGNIMTDECQKRSPVTYLSELSTTNLNLDINHGIHDGRQGSVPFCHSLQAFDALLSSTEQDERRATEWRQAFYESQRIPSSLERSSAGNSVGMEESNTTIDPLYQGRPIHYRRTKDSTRITIFEGAHEILHNAALNWLAQQRRGQPSRWEIPMDAIQSIDIDQGLAESGK